MTNEKLDFWWQIYLQFWFRSVIIGIKERHYDKRDSLRRISSCVHLHVTRLVMWMLNSWYLIIKWYIGYFNFFNDTLKKHIHAELLKVVKISIIWYITWYVPQFWGLQLKNRGLKILEAPGRWGLQNIGGPRLIGPPKIGGPRSMGPPE